MTGRRIHANVSEVEIERNEQAGFSATGVEKLRVRSTLEMLVNGRLDVMTGGT
ncbi:MAG TPA: hypothetical protein VGA51_11530 [Casimicrobiaceae bacterium]